MKIIIPLYDFNYFGNGYKFKNGIYSIGKMKKAYLKGLPFLFSRQDIYHIKEAHWCLVVSDYSITPQDRKGYIANSEILMLAFKIFINAGTFVKFRICPEDSFLNAKLNQPMMYSHKLLANKMPNGVVRKMARKLALNDRDFRVVDECFPCLLDMWDISNRTRNALQYALSGYRSRFWQESFLFYMIALEALFSSDENAGMTRTICTRVSKYLKGIEHSTYEDVNSLYNLRSQIVHGKIRIDGAGGWDKNIKATAHAEYLLACSIGKLVKSEDYRRYSKASEIQSYLGHLN
jgi:Apea-like HEPN